MNTVDLCFWVLLIFYVLIWFGLKNFQDADEVRVDDVFFVFKKL